MKTIIKLIPIFFILLFMPISANANDYFKNFGLVSGWNVEPIVCVIDPPKEQKHNIIKAVTFWQKVFDTIDLQGYDYNVFVLEEDVDDCSVIIRFVTEAEVRARAGTSLALTLCSESPTLYFALGKHAIVTRESSRMCYVYVNAYWAEGSTNPIIVHEMGHVFGIGHRAIDQQGGFAYLIETKDIMYKQLIPFAMVTEESVDALQYFYGYNGFNGLVNRDIYKIPHIE